MLMRKTSFINKEIGVSEGRDQGFRDLYLLSWIFGFIAWSMISDGLLQFYWINIYKMSGIL